MCVYLSVTWCKERERAAVAAAAFGRLKVNELLLCPLVSVCVVLSRCAVLCRKSVSELAGIANGVTQSRKQQPIYK